MTGVRAINGRGELHPLIKGTPKYQIVTHGFDKAWLGMMGISITKTLSNVNVHWITPKKVKIPICL